MGRGGYGGAMGGGGGGYGGGGGGFNAGGGGGGMGGGGRQIYVANVCQPFISPVDFQGLAC